MPPSSCARHFLLRMFVLLTRKTKGSIKRLMTKTKLIPQKDIKKPLTIRLAPAVRKEAEKLAKDNQTTLTNVVEAGLSLLFEKVKHEKA